MNTFFLTISTILVAILVALFAVPPFVDWNTYRGVFEEEASRILGRDVRVGGNVNLRILPSPYIRFEEVKIAAEDGVTGEPFLRATSFTMQLSAPPLLSGIIEARKIEIEGAKLRLRLDRDGRGNWQRVGLRPGSLSVRPSSVSLQQVSLREAEAALEDADGRILGRVDRINGDVSAPSMQGPFRFTGTAAIIGEVRDVRVGLARWDAETGSAALKLIVRTPNEGSTATFDGTLQASRNGPPTFEGDLTATLPEVFTSKQTQSAPRRAKGLPLDVKARVKLETQKVTLDDLVLSFAQGGRPQLLAGRAIYINQETPSLDLTLASRWLDLDAISGTKDLSRSQSPSLAQSSLQSEAEAKSSLRTVARAMLDRLAALRFANRGSANIDLSIAQTSIAGADVSDVAVRLAVAPTGTEVQRLVALGPGGTTIRIDGRVPKLAQSGAEQAGTPAAFKGNVALRGANVRRFLRWVSKARRDDDLPRAQAFDGRGALTLYRDRISIKDVALRVGSSAVSGQVTLGLEPDIAHAISLKGATLDLRNLGGSIGTLRGLRAALIGQKAAARSSAPGPTRPATLDLSFGRLIARETELRSVSISAERDPSGAVKVSRFTARTRSDGAVSLAGRWQRIEADQRTAEFRGTVRAARPAATRELAELMTLIGPEGERDARSSSIRDGQQPGAIAIVGAALRKLSSIDTSLTAILAPRTAVPFRLGLVGRVGSDRVDFELLGGDDLDALLSSPITATLDATLGGTDGVIELLRASGIPTGAERTNARLKDATLSVTADGIAAQSLATYVAVTAGRRRLDYRGTLKATGIEPAEYNGRILLRGMDVATLADLAGWQKVPTSAAELSVAGQLVVAGTRDRSTWTFEAVDLAGTEVNGELVLAEAESGPTTIKGAISLSELRAPLMLGGLLRDRTPTTPSNASLTSGGVQVGGATSVWPGRAFAVDRLGNLNLDLAIATDRFEATPGTWLKSARFRLQADPNQVALMGLQASAGADAAVKSDVILTRVTAGYRLESKLRLDNLALSQVFANQPRGAGEAAPSDPADDGEAAGGAMRGRARVDLNLRGEGLSPRALMALVQGSGRVTLRDTVATGVHPGAIAAAVAATADDEMDALNANLQQALMRQPLTIGARRLKLTVRDGTINVGRLRVKVKEGVAENVSTLDLVSLVSESRWRLVPNKAADQDRAWPPIAIIYTAPVRTISQTEPTLQADALARDVVLRRVEAKAAEFERLRLEDEAKAKEARARERARRERARAAREQAERERAQSPEIVPGAGSGSAPVLRAPLPVPPSIGRRSDVQPGASPRNFRLKRSGLGGPIPPGLAAAPEARLDGRSLAADGTSESEGAPGLLPRTNAQRPSTRTRSQVRSRRARGSRRARRSRTVRSRSRKRRRSTAWRRRAFSSDR